MEQNSELYTVLVLIFNIQYVILSATVWTNEKERVQNDDQKPFPVCLFVCF